MMVPPVQLRKTIQMKPTQQLHDLGQSLWLDNITRGLLTSGTLERYIQELSVTGLTSNPTIFDRAIKNSTSYDAGVQEQLSRSNSVEAFVLALPWRTFGELPTCFARSTTARTVSMAGCPWRSRRCGS